MLPLVSSIKKGKMFILLFFLVASGAVNAQNQRVKLPTGSLSIQSIFQEIEKQTNLSVDYNQTRLDVSQKKTLQSVNGTLSAILDEALRNTGFTYAIEKEHIVILQGAEKNSKQSEKRREISGTIVDKAGEPIIGANIIERGTTNGVITDIDGKFKLNVADNSVLIVSYIGYDKQELNVRGQSVVNITLSEDSKALDEVIVVGYGTQKKVNMTGAVASLSASDVKDRVQPNVLAAAQGAVPGVTIISRPGSAPTINFRGRGNLGTSEPLYVIDGAIADVTFFSNLDPNSIESISFLKDAASSSIYGARAAYGVVLVTTKQGKEDRMQVTYSGYVGMKSQTYKPELVNSWEYAELFNESKYNSNPAGGKNQGFSDEEIKWFRDGSKPDLYPNTDWIDLVYDKQAPTTQHSLNFTGGSQKLRYFAGLGYLYDGNNVRNRDDQRYNLNLNVASDITSWLTFRGSVKYIQNTNRVDGGTPSMNDMLIVPSTFVARQSDGEWGSVDSGREASATFAGGNPLRSYDNRSWTRTKAENTMYDLAFDLKPIEGLVITGQGIYKSWEKKYKAFWGTRDEVPSFLKPGTTIGGTGNTLNSMNMEWYSDSRLMYTAMANYTRTWGIHSFSALAGMSYEHYKYEKLIASRENFPADSFTDMSAGATSGAGYKNDSESYENKMLSYFGRINYTLLDRYMLEVNFRADASSRFYQDNRWGLFPSFSAGWRLSEEHFMADTRSWLDNLKLRVSYGTLGNINNVGNYDYFANYSNAGLYSFDNNPVKALKESKPANRTLGWEKVALTDIGLDFDLLGGKLSGTMDYYVKNTSDILLAYNVPVETGISNAPSQNSAKVRNQGLELSLTHRNKIGEVTYSIGGNIATNKNKITDLASSKDIIQNLPSGHGVAKYIFREGEAIGSFYGFKTDGLYTQADIDAGHYYTYGGTTPNAGDVKFIPQSDLKYGEAITDKDRVIIGNDVPKFTYGLNLSVEYKNIELSVFGQGVNGTNVAFEVYQIHPFFHGQDNPRTYHLKRWTEANPNPHAIYPRLYDASSPHTAYNRAFSDYHLFDADYFRFKTITLGYKVPKQQTAKWGMSDLRFFITGENLLTLRADNKMEDFDPETAGSVVQTLGTKSIAFGINVSF